MGTTQDRYAIDELADLAGVSRRTVRYYVQEGLLPAPLGVGRGRHYDAVHLERLLQVRAWQEAGRSLDDIRRLLGRGGSPHQASRPAAGAWAAHVERTIWRRLTLGAGLELHVARGRRLPSARELEELAARCRELFGLDVESEEDNA